MHQYLQIRNDVRSIYSNTLDIFRFHIILYLPAYILYDPVSHVLLQHSLCDSLARGHRCFLKLAVLRCISIHSLMQWKHHDCFSLLRLSNEVIHRLSINFISKFRAVTGYFTLNKKFQGYVKIPSIWV